jgi:pyridoxal phosphate phosphatase PHOSPHO2
LFTPYSLINILYSQDLVLCRLHRGLHKRINNEGQKEGIECQVKYWGGAWEIEEIFDNI